MKTILFVIIVLQVLVAVHSFPKEAPISSKFDNPNFVRDRQRNIFPKPEMPPTWANRFKTPFTPAWMDYCAPYHCDDNHKTVCGINRQLMRFRYFQSTCHLILHNQCSDFRGHDKFDWIELKYCAQYVMYLRTRCPVISECKDELDPICAISSIDGHAVVFKSRCHMEVANCRNTTIQEYDEVYMDICEMYLILKKDQ